MRIRSIKILFCSFLLILVFILTGCGAAQLARPTPAQGAPTYDITGECSISIKDNVITVSGKTNFDAGVFLNVSVLGNNGMTIDSATITQKNPNEQISQDFTIDEKYNEVNKVVGYITCAPTLYGKHPAEGIYQKYGDKFECINTDTKNYIWVNDGVVVLFASDMIGLPK
jgi:hypothetical protein